MGYYYVEGLRFASYYFPNAESALDADFNRPQNSRESVNKIGSRKRKKRPSGARAHNENEREND